MPQAEIISLMPTSSAGFLQFQSPSARTGCGDFLNLSGSRVKLETDLSEDHSIMTEGLLSRLANGDGHAMNECIDQYGNLVWSIVRRCFFDPVSAEDVVQEIFTEIWTKASTYKPEIAGESTWIALIARRRTIDAYRKLSRRPVMEELPDPEILGAESSDTAPVPSLSREEAKRLLQRLPDTTRTMIEMALHDGFTHQEIADKLKQPLGTVKTRIRRGLLELRDIIVSQSGSATDISSTLTKGEDR